MTLAALQCYAITPVPAPRMTQADKWQSRMPVQRYRMFRDLVKLNGVWLPVPFRHVIFVLPMWPSWTPMQKAHSVGMPHTQKPDRDNLEKALLDSVLGEDAAIWDGRTTKLWGHEGMIIISGVNIEVVPGMDLAPYWTQAMQQTRVKDLPRATRRRFTPSVKRNVPLV